jgi:hypothetical protein
MEVKVKDIAIIVVEVDMESIRVNTMDVNNNKDMAVDINNKDTVVDININRKDTAVDTNKTMVKTQLLVIIFLKLLLGYRYL